jgi:hypothetical protein
LEGTIKALWGLFCHTIRGKMMIDDTLKVKVDALLKKLPPNGQEELEQFLDFWLINIKLNSREI